MDLYAPGGAQPSFDKQYVRDFLLSIRWDKKPPGPRLPDEIIRTTAQKYEDALLRLTGTTVQ
jgi:phosphoribosylaminoimidazole-succinocarboxamide synthase